MQRGPQPVFKRVDVFLGTAKLASCSEPSAIDRLGGLFQEEAKVKPKAKEPKAKGRSLKLGDRARAWLRKVLRGRS